MVCVWSVVVSVGILGTVKEYECNDEPVELLIVSAVIDWLVDVGISLLIDALDDEILLVSVAILLLLDST
jgi:hypothetical protein